MEFEWDSGHGPSDITSPFMQITQKLGTTRKILQPSSPSLKFASKVLSNLANSGGFESPIKNPSQPPNPPTQNQSSFFGGGAFGVSATPAKAFRNPGFESTPSRLGLLQQQSKPTPFRDAPFTTPRKPFDSPYFSEATGDESSPGLLGDNEDTPETRTGRSTQIKSFSNIAAIKPKEGGLFGRYGKLSHSPGRGDIRRGNKYDISNPQRVMKRRRMDREREQILTHSRRSSFDSDSENSNPSSRPAKATTAPVPQQGMLASFFTFISSHPDLPSTIAKWMQLSLNFFFGVLALYLCWAILSAIRHEVDLERLKAIDIIQSEIAACVAEYTKNNCAASTRPPALDAFCRLQEDCFSRDPERVGRARVSAGTFSMIINNFFEGFSLKTSAILIGGAAVFVVASNMGFSAAKQKLHHDPTAFIPGNFGAQQMGNQGWDPRPAEVWFQQLPALQAGGMTPGRGFATPARGMRGERGMGNEGWGEEFRAIMPSGSPIKSPRKQSRN